MAIVNKPDMNYGVWAEGGNIEIPSSDKVEEGWVIEKPLNEQMNWLQNRQDKMLQYINQHGIPEWDFSTEYPIDAFAVEEGLVYQATSQNQDAKPSENSEIWKIAFASYADYVDYESRIDSIENDDGYLAHYVKKSAPVMDAPVKGVAYNNLTGVSGLSFDGNTPVIKNNNTTVATFSGLNNPKDVVTYEQLMLAIQTYKVGDIHITTMDGDPKLKLGYGEWTRYGEGRAIVGFSTSVSNQIPQWVKTANVEFGSYDHKLTVAEMPRHTHDLNFTTGNISGNTRPSTGNTSASASNLTATHEGGDQTHNNVQPSITVYMWKRVS